MERLIDTQSMEKTDCKIIGGASATLAVKGMMMMMSHHWCETVPLFRKSNPNLELHLSTFRMTDIQTSQQRDRTVCNIELLFN